MNDTTNIESRARKLFLDACDHLDSATLVELRKARAAALAAPTAPRSRRLLLPAGALAASVLALVFVWQTPQPQASDQTPSASAAFATSNGSTPVADEDVDLYNNLDFYAWLATQPVVAGGGN